MGGEDGEQTTDFFTVAFCAYYIIGMLMADEKFKFGFAIRAAILVQWHRK